MSAIFKVIISHDAKLLYLGSCRAQSKCVGNARVSVCFIYAHQTDDFQQPRNGVDVVAVVPDVSDSGGSGGGCGR